LFGYRYSIFFYRARLPALRPIPQLRGPGLCIYIPPVSGLPSYTFRHWVPFS
jgi:hypothetical protein